MVPIDISTLAIQPGSVLDLQPRPVPLLVTSILAKIWVSTVTLVIVMLLVDFVKLDPQQGHREIGKWCLALVGLGGASWLIEAALFLSWVMFGELQAKVTKKLNYHFRSSNWLC
jgi:hypothetical protein